MPRMGVYGRSVYVPEAVAQGLGVCRSERKEGKVVGAPTE